MGWVILIVVLLAARGKAVAVSSVSSAPQPRSTLPVQQGRVPLTAVEHVSDNPNVVAFGGGVTSVTVSPGTVLNLPYQTRDPKLPSASIIGPSQDAQLASALDSSMNAGGGDAFGLWAASAGFE